MNEDTNIKAQKSKSSKIVKLLADYQGVDVGDISTDDGLIDDLHMNASDITDFLEKLYNEGYDTEKIDLSEMQTVGDIIDLLGSDEEL